MKIPGPKDEWEVYTQSNHWHHTSCGEKVLDTVLGEPNSVCPGCGQPVPRWLQEMFGPPIIVEDKK